jgi:uncharacterized membrane protein
MTETPVCPPHWKCEFNPVVIKHHFIGPWYETGWGIVVAILAIIALAIILCTLIVYIREARGQRLDLESEERMRLRKEAHELALEEQRTMQADAAKGNIEFLKVLRSNGG